MAAQSKSKQSDPVSLSESLALLNPQQLKALLSKANKRELAAIEEAWKLTIRTSLTAWCSEALAPMGFRPAKHHRLLISHLERLARGDTTRLMVLMPLGASKS